jgi:hypothetical protein
MTEPKKPDTEPRVPVEEHAKAKGTAAWLFAGAKLGNRWPTGCELTEAEYDAAIHAAANVQIR